MLSLYSACEARLGHLFLCPGSGYSAELFVV